jgi:M6 family metalloprotease-like protein
MRNTLLPNEILYPGDRLTSSNGYYNLRMQTDGKLELCNLTNYIMWSSNESESTNNHAIMQEDGNLVVYNRSNVAIWASNTEENPNAYLKLQDDRNLVIYNEHHKPIWDSNTQLRDTLRSGHVLNIGERLVSLNGYYYLTLQADGDLVMFDNQNFVIWKLETNVTTAKYLELSMSGSLRLYTRDRSFIRIYNTEGNFNAKLTLNNNRDLVITNQRNRILWNSGTAYPEKRELIIRVKDVIQINRELLKDRNFTLETDALKVKNKPNNSINAVISFMYEDEGNIQFTKKTKDGRITTVKITAKLQGDNSIKLIRTISYPNEVVQTKHVTIPIDSTVNEASLRDDRNIEYSPRHTDRISRPTIFQNDFEIFYQNRLIIGRLDFFQKPHYKRLSNQGSATAPKRVPLLPIIWEYKDLPPSYLTKEALYAHIFGETNSVSHWIAENSLNRYNIIPVDVDPNKAIIGPIKSTFSKNYYTGGSDTETGRTASDDGWSYSYDASYPDAITGAAREGFDFSFYGNERITVDDLIILIIKPQWNLAGYSRELRNASGSKFEMEGKTFDMFIAEVYTNLQRNSIDIYEPEANLAIFIEEIMHTGTHIVDKYADGDRSDDDPEFPGQLSLTSAQSRPVHLDAFDKLQLGWLKPILVTSTGFYKIRQTNITGDSLIVYNPLMKNSEFFIIENRTRGDSYDKYRGFGCTTNCIEGDGIAIWHCIKQDLDLLPNWNWARFATNLRRPQPNLYRNTTNDPFPLFSKDRPEAFYLLSDDSFPQNLRFRNNVKSGIIIRDISTSGYEMTIEIDIDSTLSSL